MKFLITALVLGALSFNAFADDLLLKKNSGATFVIGKTVEKLPLSEMIYYSLSVSYKVGKKVVTAQQTCSSFEQCQQMKHELEKASSNLKEDEYLALHFQSTNVNASVVERPDARALPEMPLTHLMSGTIIRVGDGGLAANVWYYGVNGNNAYACMLNASENFLVKEGTTFFMTEVTAGWYRIEEFGQHPEDRHYDARQTLLKFDHPAVSSINCQYRERNRDQISDVGNAIAVFKNRLEVYVPKAQILSQDSPGVKETAKK